MTLKAVAQLEHSLSKLQKQWPSPLSKDVLKLFEKAEESLKTLKHRPKKSSSKNTFHFVSLIQQVLKTHDILFLNRRLSYHVVATADLAPAYGSEQEALTVLTELLSATAKHAGPGSKLEITVQNVSLREGPAIQTRLEFDGKTLSDLDRQKLLEELYGDSDLYAKTILRHAGGQFWLAFPSETRAALTFNWPAYERPKAKVPSGFGAYKYDIWLTDYAKIRQHFGIPKCEKLMKQIEEFTRSLVRHPVDIVISFPEQGMVTAIYESQEGGASSVATRISQQLKKESFRIGQKNVVPKFRYQLTFLA